MAQQGHHFSMMNGGKQVGSHTKVPSHSAESKEELAELWSKFAEDEYYKQFLNDDFDVDTHASKLVQGIAISEQLGHLAQGINQLDKTLHSQVAEHYDDLLSQATGVEKLQSVLEMMQTRIQSLKLSMERIRSRVVEPYEEIAGRTAQLRRLQTTCDLIRTTSRVMYLSKRLAQQIQGGVKDVTKAAQSLSELDYLVQNVDLSGIEVVEADRVFVKQARQEVELQAWKMIEQGMEGQAQTQVGTALQVFYNLNILSEAVDKVIRQQEERLESLVEEAIKIQRGSVGQHAGGGPGGAAMPAVGNVPAYRATLWANMDRLMDNIHTACSKVEHLERVLTKKRDPVTHVGFMDELERAGRSDLMTTFWYKMSHMLSEKFERASNTNTYIKQAFEVEYPKLLRLYNELWARLRNVTKTINETKLAALMSADSGEQNAEKVFKESLQPFEKAFLTRSLSSLFDPINLVFPVGVSDPPSEEEIEKVISAMQKELSVSSVDADLCVTVSKNLCKTVRLFCVKSEQLLCMDGEASQVIGALTDGQVRNTDVINLLASFQSSVIKLVTDMSNIPGEGRTLIHQALEATSQLVQNAVQPLLRSVLDSVEAILLTMHNEDFSPADPALTTLGGPADADAHCSLYMKELQGFLLRVSQDYLSGFSPLASPLIEPSVRQIACRCLALFVQHASILPRLGRASRMVLAADCAHMELAVSPLCPGGHLVDLGASYKMLRAFRPILFQTAEDIAGSGAVGEVLPYSVVLNYLFSCASGELLLPPHTVAGWSVSRYSLWLDEHHNEAERLALIRATLERYAQGVHARHGSEYDDVYPIMKGVLDRALAALGTTSATAGTGSL